jgi:hypothetical protein
VVAERGRKRFVLEIAKYRSLHLHVVVVGIEHVDDAWFGSSGPV